MQVRDVDIPGLQALGQQFTGVWAGDAMPNLIAATVRQGKVGLPLTNAGQLGRQIGQMMGDEVNDLTHAGYGHG